MKKIIFLFIGLFFLKIYVNAQEAGWILKDYSNYAYAFAEEDSFMWVGTAKGVLRFDKVNGNFIVYDTSNSELPSQAIISVYIDVAGRKWFGSGGAGLVGFDGNTWSKYFTNNSGLPNNSVNAIAGDENGMLWIGTGNGLATFDGINWTTYNSSNSELNDNDINCIYIDESGIIWIGTNSAGLVKIEGSEWTCFNWNNSGLPSPKVNAITMDRNGIAWIATGGGLVKFDGTNWTVYDETNSELWSSNIASIALDKDGAIWIGVREWGISKFDGNHFTNIYYSGTGHVIGSAISIAVDENGLKWIGAYAIGIFIYNEHGMPFSINENIWLGNKIEIYPNPANEYFYIKKDADVDISSIEIFNLNGSRLMIQEALSKSLRINVSDLLRGIYLMKINTERGFLIKKLIKT